jgi:hypothetical protein
LEFLRDRIEPIEPWMARLEADSAGVTADCISATWPRNGTAAQMKKPKLFNAIVQDFLDPAC